MDFEESGGDGRRILYWCTREDTRPARGPAKLGARTLSCRCCKGRTFVAALGTAAGGGAEVVAAVGAVAFRIAAAVAPEAGQPGEGQEGEEGGDAPDWK